MKSYARVLLILSANLTTAFLPAVQMHPTPTRLLLNPKRNEIAKEIKSIEKPPASHTHDANPWKKMLGHHDYTSRQHEFKKHMVHLKRENEDLERHVAQLERELGTLFAIAEGLAMSESDLRHEVNKLRSERNDLRRMGGRALVLVGRRFLWPFRAMGRLIGWKKASA